MKHVLRWCAALVALALALPAQAAEATKISDVAHSVFFRGGSGTRGAAGTNGGHASDRYFNGDFTDYTYCNGNGTTELVVDVSHIVTDPDGQAYVTDVLIGHQGNAQYSLYYTNEPEPENLETYATDPRTWTPIAGADHVQEAGTKTYGVNDFATAVKYVFNTCPNWTTHLAEIEVQGYEYVPPKAVKISAVGRSVFFRGGSGTRGAAGTNGGHASDRYFNGDFTDYTYCNGNGVTELVIPTTGLDDQGTDTGVAWYVTDFKVGHQGNAQYSLYYTDEPEPANLETYASDPRTWTLIAGADHVQEAGTKTFGVNAFATAVKYVFNTCPNWTTHLAEVEVWAMDPSSITCLHPNMTDDSPAWTVCKAATCTENGFEERFCPDCGARFEREVPLSKLGHDFVATLTAPGTAAGYGSGYVECSRCNEFHIEFNGNHVDLTTLGGPPINGIVQYTDLYASSLGAEDGGIKPVYMMDNLWDNGWGHAYYFAECSSNEYAQYSFGTTIELTQIEYSVINEYQTVYFSSYDPATDEETLLKTILIEKNTNEGAPGYQRATVYFQSDDPSQKIFVKAVRMRIGHYVDPDTGEVTNYIGYNYGAHDRHTIICEFHPWGTIEGAGKLLSVAQIGDNGYDSVTNAISAITGGLATGTTIILQKSTAEDIVIPAGTNVTINLNGNSITNVSANAIAVNGTLTVTGSGEVVATGANKAVSVANGGSATLSGGTFRGGVEAAQGGSLVVSQGCLFDTSVPLAYCPDGFMCSAAPNASGLYSIVQRTIPTSATATEEEQAAATAANARVYNDKVQAQFPASNDSGALAFVRVYAEDGSFVTLRTSDGAQTIDTTKLGGAPSRIVAFYGDQVTATEGVDAPALVEEPEVVVENGAVSVNLSVPVVSGLYYAIVGEDGAVLSAINGGAAVSPSDDGVAKPATVTPSAADWGVLRFKVQAQDVPFNQN